MFQAKLGDGVAKIGQGKAFKNKWIKKSSSGNLVRCVESVDDQTRSDLLKIQKTGTHEKDDTLKDLKRRKLCDKVYTRFCMLIPNNSYLENYFLILFLKDLNLRWKSYNKLLI